MAPDPLITRPRRHRWELSSETLSNARLALVACTLLATVAVLLAVTGQAHGAQDALDEASAQTLRDYSGYASRLLGADVLRRFSEQRAIVLAPVTGSSGRDIPAPALTDIARLGRERFALLGALGDTALGYYRIDVATGRIDDADGVKGEFARRIADTVSTLVPGFTPQTPPGIAAIEWGHATYSVVFAPFFDAHQRLVAVYGFAYTRSAMVGTVAATVFREVPLLPVSFAGARWNYDTTRVRAGEVINDSLIAMRVSDRRGRLLWETRDAGSVIATSPYGARSVLSTNAGGIVVEAAMRQAAEPSLIPRIVRRAQSWTLRSLIALAFLLVMVSLIALRGERQGARARRVEGNAAARARAPA